MSSNFNEVETIFNINVKMNNVHRTHVQNAFNMNIVNNALHEISTAAYGVISRGKFESQVHQAVVTNHFCRQIFGKWTFGGHANSRTISKCK